MIIKPIPPNVLDQVRRHDVAVLDLGDVRIHIFGDYNQLGGDIIIRICPEGERSFEYRARDEREAREIIGRVVLELPLWKIAS